MNTAKRKALEGAGWKIGDAADFLQMTAEERQLLDTRVKVAQAVRQLRQARHLSQVQLGAKLKTSQPRIAKIERAASDVSLDQLVRAFTATGGTIVVEYSDRARAKKTGKSTSGKARASRQGTARLRLKLQKT